MLVVVKNPHIEISGNIPADFLQAIKERFPGQVREGRVLARETDFWKETEVTGGKVLKICRENEGMTQEEVAEKIGNRKQNISAMERGVKSIGGHTAVKLSKLFDQPVEAFLQGVQ